MVRGDDGLDRVVTLKGAELCVWQARTEKILHLLSAPRTGLHWATIEVFADLGVVLYATAEGVSVLSLHSSVERRLTGVTLHTPPAFVSHNQRIYFRRQSPPSTAEFGYYDTVSGNLVMECSPDPASGPRSVLITDGLSGPLAYCPATGSLVAVPRGAHYCVYGGHLLYLAKHVHLDRCVGVHSVYAVPLGDPMSTMRTLMSVEKSLPESLTTFNGSCRQRAEALCFSMATCTNVAPSSDSIH